LAESAQPAPAPDEPEEPELDPPKPELEAPLDPDEPEELPSGPKPELDPPPEHPRANVDTSDAKPTNEAQASRKVGTLLPSA
jgi:hypothetical protein